VHDLLPPAGSIVWIRQQRWRVERSSRDRNVVRLDVRDRERRITFLAPFDRPAAVDARRRRHAVRPQQALARCAGLLASAHGVRSVASAVQARVDLLPHQLEPALAVAAGVRRILIADDVGLGKTIQAALVLAELRRRQPALRALIVVPSGLRAQWREELASRFDLGTELADRHGLDAAAASGAFGDNAWRRPAIWMTSLDFLKQPHVRDGLPLIPWDLVVVDEAHDACGDSARYEVCEQVARGARHVLLLSATPHSGDRTRFSRLQGLGALDGLDDPLTIFRRTRADLGVPVARRVAWRVVAPSLDERRVLDALTAFERTVLARADDRRRADARLLLSVFRKRALSTMAALNRSVERRLSWIDGPARASDLDWVQPRFDFDGADDDVRDDERTGLTADIGVPAAHERIWLRRLRTLIQPARRRERKIRWLASAARRTTEPLIVFTEFRHSLEAIESELARVRPVSVLHGGQPPFEREQALSRFLTGLTSALVATDVAGQGLNLQQRARWVVSVELPWNPARLEQRIGRVDRIGQPRRVHATILVANHPAEQGLLANLARRTLAARGALGPDVLGDLAPPEEDDVAAALLDGDDHVMTRCVSTVPTTREFRRAAGAEARRLRKARRLSAFWRAEAASHAVLWTRLRLQRPGALPADRALVICSVPILDGNGLEVERHLCALVVPAHVALRRDAASLVSAAAGVARARLPARVARVRRLIARAAEHRARVDAAVACYLHSLGCPEETQPGLFSPTDNRQFDLARSSATDILRAARSRSGRFKAASDLTLGTPAVELVFTWRP
jgi:superfamily II DNA or RNA helicase